MAELKLTRFVGLVPRLHERNLPENSATKILDVDLSNGTLKPFRTNKKVSDKTGKYIFVDNCCYITSDNCKASVDIIEDECSIGSSQQVLVLTHYRTSSLKLVITSG